VTPTRNIRNIQLTENFLWKAKVVGYLLTPVILIFALTKACNRVDKHYAAKCSQEKTLSFEGVITNYKTNIRAETSTFNLNDSFLITIPRSSKEMYINNDDTITKIKGANMYIVKRATIYIGRKAIDTFKFDCPGLQP
jgi:hypothetical protein